MRPLLLSLKPIYADLVFSGLKTAELRRHITKDVEGRDVFIYVSSPERKLRGGFRVDKVWEGTPDVIWEEVKHLAQVDEATFVSYYEGRSKAFALNIAYVWEHKHPISLANLRLKFPGFVVPQSWRYLTPDENRSFSRMTRTSDASAMHRSKLPSGQKAPLASPLRSNCPVPSGQQSASA